MLFLYGTSISSNINCYNRNSSFKLINTLLLHKSAFIMHCLGTKKNPTHIHLLILSTNFGMR